MKDKIIINDETQQNVNKKSIMIIGLLIIAGIFTGLFISNYFLIDANESISEWNEGIDKWQDYWDNKSSGNWSNWSNWSNSSNGNFSENESSFGNNSNSTGFFTYLDPLSYNDVILPIITVILLTISSYFLFALNVTYILIYRSSKSKYVLGLLFALIPMLIVSIFLIRTVKNLFFSSALERNWISVFFGFDISGLGGMLSILSLFMIIGFGILLYLSNE